ncbi:AI-2E family transporter [Qipengyuania sp.]|uniref:AI-2E family transporter n=1 Tax=Qipengyuania sp. TaxID=2004515 RepID=UPI00373684BE
MIEPPPTGGSPEAERDAPRGGMSVAQQELRLMSALVVLIGMGLFLALPFVLSIGSVVFLPVVTAVVLTIVLSPLADRLYGWGVPNGLASLLALIVFFAILVAALGLILQPAVALFDGVPVLLRQVGARFSQLQDEFAWIGQLNRQLAEMMKSSESREVVLASPSFLEELAFATPSVVIEAVLTLLMAYFLIEARVRMRQRLLLGRASFGSSIKAARVLREVQDRVAAYILTVGWINALVGVVVALGAWLLGLEAPIMWGGLAAILNFLPYIGPMLMMALLALFGIGTSETVLVGLIPALAYLGLHTLEANVFTPSILGARFTVNPVMILIALSYFTWIWGVLGALLSVPILLILAALFDHIGRPNLIGFVFGEPLFPEALVSVGDDDPAP